MNNWQNRCPTHCVLPPYVIEIVLSRAKTDAHKNKLLNSLALSSQHRGMRRATSRLVAGAGNAEIFIYDAHHAEDTSEATLIWRESKSGTGPLSDPAAENVRKFTLATRDFYKDVLHRNSVDDSGLDLKSYVHFSQDWDNAQWDGSEMEYGDGDGIEFNSFTSSIDVVGHELTHGVTQYTSDLYYQGQSGALNESFSDVMGSLIKQKSLGQTVDQADWLIGEKLFKNGDSLRSMKKPGTAFAGDPQPATMDGYVKTNKDNGGVHLNSSIPNRAFFEACNAFGKDKKAWETIGPIWYAAFTSLKPHATFHTAARATLVRAKHVSQQHVAAVSAGWEAVKVKL